MNKLSMKTSSRSHVRGAIAAAAVAVILAGCGTMAEPNSALERAHASYRALQGDPQSTVLAPSEMAQASEALRTADAAWSRKETLANVDHLAYLAQQRVAIAREAAGTKTWEKTLVTTKTGTEADKARAAGDQARSDVADARQRTRDKSAELAAANAGAKEDKAHATELEMQLKALNAKQTERGEVITLGDVLFDSGRAEIRGGGLRDMGRLVDFFKSHPKRTAQIEGFTDSQGSDSANLDLSQRRAAAVRDALVAQGVEPARLSPRGFGESNPASTNDTAAGRQMNRRVEIVLSGEDGTVRGR